jgi:hypothetical protein
MAKKEKRGLLYRFAGFSQSCSYSRAVFASEVLALRFKNPPTTMPDIVTRYKSVYPKIRINVPKGEWRPKKRSHRILSGVMQQRIID